MVLLADALAGDIGPINREAGHDLGESVAQALIGEVAGMTVAAGDGADEIRQHAQFARQCTVDDELLVRVQRLVEIRFLPDKPRVKPA